MTKLKHVLRLQYGSALPADIRSDGAFSVFGSNGKVGTHNESNMLAPAIVVGRKGSHGKIAWAGQGGYCIDTALFVDRRHSSLHLRYAYYLLQSLGLDEPSKDSAVPGLDRSYVHNKAIPLVSSATQKAIAAFLDRETARIDQLIAKKERMVEVLAEKFQATVEHTVTHGMDGEATIVESGIDTIGAMPFHWEAVGLGKKIVLQRGVDITKDQQAEDGEYPVVSSGGVASFHDTYICKGPGVLIGRKGSAGKLHYEQRNYWPHDTTLYVKHFFGNVPKFVYYKLMAMDLGSFDRSSANPTINRNLVHPIKVSWPPVSDQFPIVRYLDHQNRQRVQLESKVNASIQKLAEFRAALITAAVTGQIDVATWGRRGETDRRLDEIAHDLEAERNEAVG